MDQAGDLGEVPVAPLSHEAVVPLSHEAVVPLSHEAVVPLSHETAAPLSHEQEQLWLVHQMTPEAPVGTECTMVTLRGELDVTALRDSLAAFIQRHEIWRTSFPSRDGAGVQVVHAEGRCPWSELDLGGLREAQREEAALRQAEAEARPPFDLARGPLLRALLVRMGEQEHRLFLTLHQIISDRASLTWVFLPELRELYESRVQGRAEDLGQVGSRYADYARWQRGRPAGERAEDLRFWAEYLAGAPTVLALPADHRRPDHPSYRAQTQPFVLGGELLAGARELSNQEQVTLSITLTAAFEALLHRYTGQEDLLVGVTAPGRARPEAQRMVGRFAHPVVLRADLAGDPTAAELLRRTQAAAQAVRGHEDVPWTAVVQAAQPDQGLSEQPRVQVMLTFEPRPPALPAGWDVSHTDVPPLASQFDLHLEVAERADGLTGRLIYNSDLFERATISRMIGHLRMVLHGMVAQPWRRVAEIGLLDEQETERLLGAWSSGAGVRAGADVAELIEEQAKARPDAVAVVCDGAHLSYRELNDRASQLARYLRTRGVAAEVAVGVGLERSPEQVIALLGILKAGGAYVPLDPEAPVERIQHVVRDTRMSLLLTQQRLAAKLRGTAPEVVSLDGHWAVTPREGTQERPVADELPTVGELPNVDELPSAGELPTAEERPGHPRASQLGYVIYTSGSTGQPKGVMIERGTLAAHTRAMIREYGLGPLDNVLQFSQYSFDASLEQIVPALAAGARLIMRGPQIWSPRQLRDEVKKQQVTVMNLPPAYWQQAMREWAAAPDELTGTQLRLVIVGGDRLGAQGVRHWRELGLRGARLLNAYGPTETTITATLGEVTGEEERITIGRPLPGRRVYILDRGGRPVPAGVIGELHIGGDLLARGYLNQPELTSERFVSDPFRARPEAPSGAPSEAPSGARHGRGPRLYRTGDLARYLADGRIDYVGRHDQQVKIRGYRIELGEVEAVLGQHPGVEEAVVVATSAGPGGDPELAAYVVGRSAAPVEEELRSYLREKLPGYMQPAVIEQLATMPRLATGKPDRRGLPEVRRGTRRGSEGYRAPRLPAQRQLVQIFEELLEAGPIGIRDNFFDLGGHSLLAAQLVDRIEQAFGTRLPLSTLFAKPTVQQLARALPGGQERGPEQASVLPVQVGGSRRPFFFLHGYWTGAAFYCFALARAAGPEQPFYVLEPYRFSAQEDVPTLEAMATAHIGAMREVQPHGPYRLGGFCNGGLLAYEMARQLEGEGEQLEFLGLINPSAPIQVSALRSWCGRILTVMGAGPGPQAEIYLRVRHALRHIYRHLRPGGRRVQDFGPLLDIEPRLTAMFPPREALYQDYVGVFNWVTGNYRTGIYGGKITFYWAREEPLIARSWRPVTDGKKPADNEQHMVAGTLMSSVTDHIQGMAESLGESLSRAEQEARAAAGRHEAVAPR